MLVILDKKGNVAAYTGGTVAGIGSVGLETAGTFATAGAIAVGAKAIQHGLENAKITGIPKSVNINTNSKIDVSGVIKTVK